MYKTVFYLFLCFTISLHAFSQDSARHFLISIFDDNDFMNTLGPLTDHAYTNGSGGNISFIRKEGSGNFLNRWMPTAGKQSTQILTYGIEQDMYTPTNLSTPFFEPDDYRYSGALYLTHSLASFDSIKRRSLKTTLTAGVMGHWSLAEQIQSGVHESLGYENPKGWGNQYNNDALLNIALRADQELVHAGKWLECIGAVNAAAGTMLCSAGGEIGAYIGKMQPYYKGTLGRLHGKGWQVYGKAALSKNYVLYNAVYQGGLFSKRPIVPEMKIVEIGNVPFLQLATVRENTPAIKPVQNMGTCSIVIVNGRFSVTYTQTKISKVLKGLYADLYGSMTLSWLW